MLCLDTLVFVPHWVLLYPMRSFDPLSGLSCPVSFFYRTGRLCPMMPFMACVDSFSWNYFWLQGVLSSSWDLVWPMWVRCVPWRIFKTSVYIWTLCATQGILYPCGLFPCGTSSDRTGSVVPLLFHQTQIEMSKFYVHTCRKYTIYIRTYWGLSYHLNVLQSVTIVSEQVHMRMFDPVQLRPAVRFTCHIAPVVCSNSSCIKCHSESCTMCVFLAVRSEEFPRMLEVLNEFARTLVDCRDSSVSIVTRLLTTQQTNHGSIPGMEFFSSPRFPDRLWISSSFVFDDTRWLRPF